MKRIICVMAVLMVAIMALAGCNNASGNTTTPASTKPVATTPAPTTPATTPAATQPVATTSAPTTPTTTPAPTEPTTEEPVDELALLLTTFEMAERENGLFLLRNDKIYVMKFYWKDNSIVDYPVVNKGSGSLIKFYLEDYYYDHGLFRSLGNVPIPVVSKDDRLIAFSEYTDIKCRLFPVTCYGHTFPIERGGLGEFYIIDKYGTEVTIPGKTSFEVMDVNGKVLDDYYALEKDGEYTISWYEGSRYKEISVIANCNVFRYDPDSQPIVQEMKTTKKGYFELDLSGVPNGLYFSPSWPSLVFEISN